MIANGSNDNDTDRLANWNASWDLLKNPSGRDLPAAALSAEAASIIESCRAATEGRDIEHLENCIHAAYRLTADQLAAGCDERLKRFIVMLGGALSVLRQIPEGDPPNLGNRHPLFSLRSDEV